MAKRPRKKQIAPAHPSPGRVPAPAWIPLLLALVAFAAYWPSLKSDFVYDARLEILEEGFVTSLSNLPDILSLKVLGMNLTLGSRPGQMLFQMANAAAWGKEPFGYHLSSNLLHAANVALLFILLGRLVTTEAAPANRADMRKIWLATAAVTLIFALHPIGVESVAEVSYSSSLLVTFFTLLMLLAATAFRPENLRSALLTGTLGTIFAFAAVACKESGAAAAALLVVYWFLFRRREAKRPWLVFLAAALAATLGFLAARFTLAPAGADPLAYLGGSLPQVFLIQPRLWVFMMGKLLWPYPLSADYAPTEELGPPTALAFLILAVVVALQLRLAFRSPLGALGAATYWLGLATVSNFIPLYRPLADRFYYLPLAGVAMQLLALFLMTARSRQAFRIALAACLVALIPLTLLTLSREALFVSDGVLWRATVHVSPLSSIAHSNLGFDLFKKGQLDEAMAEFEKAIEIFPNFAEAHNNLGAILAKKGRIDEAVVHYQKSLALHPDYSDAHNNYGLALVKRGEIDACITQFREATRLNPNSSEAHDNLGFALFQKGQGQEGMAEFQKALEINPAFAKARYNFGVALSQKGDTDGAMAQYRKTLEIDPNFAGAHHNLGVILFQKGQVQEAIAQFQEVLRIKPDDVDAQNNLAKIQAVLQQSSPRHGPSR